MAHLVNPISSDVIMGKSLDKALTGKDPVANELMRRGLMLYDHNARTLFGEGLTGLEKIPAVGGFMQKLQEHLFNTYIPSLKLEMAKHAWERNLKRYGKDIAKGNITREGLMEITVAQANAAFGELNYNWLGRNKTLQDAIRLGALAPDFLEARLRFAGQALRPYGAEQRMALIIRLGVMQFVAAKMLNSLFNPPKGPEDVAKHAKNYPFSVKAGDRTYGLRSLSGDLVHLAQDPTGFLLYRASVPMRLLIQAGSKYYKGIGLEWSDIVTRAQMPLPLQGAARDLRDWLAGRSKEHTEWLDSLLESFGVQSHKYLTPEQHEALERRQEQRIQRLRRSR